MDTTKERVAINKKQERNQRQTERLLERIPCSTRAYATIEA